MDHAANLPSAELLERLAPLQAIESSSAVRVHLARNVFALWEEWERESGGRREVPYWAVPWPAAIAFCRFLSVHPLAVRGQRVVDLGCGGAAAGIAASLAGARQVTANDTDPVALHLAHYNAAANQVTLRLDPRDLTQVGLSPDTQVVLVGDLFYERRPATRLEAFLRTAVRQGIEVLIADAGRPFAPRTGVVVLATESVAVDTDLEGTTSRTVRILRLLAADPTAASLPA